MSKEEIKPGNATKHGGYKTKPYRAWSRIKTKCYNSKYVQFHLYGGRGIKMCERWMNSYFDFISDVGQPPTDKHTLDRYPDTNGNYEPGNVRWATQKEQQANRRDNRWIEYGGEKRILSDWARIIGILPNDLSQKLKTKPFPELYLKYKEQQ